MWKNIKYDGLPPVPPAPVISLGACGDVAFCFVNTCNSQTTRVLRKFAKQFHATNSRLQIDRFGHVNRDYMIAGKLNMRIKRI